VAGDYTSNAGHTLCPCRQVRKMHSYHATYGAAVVVGMTTLWFGGSGVRNPTEARGPTQPPIKWVITK
jgi:hypothetical protein